jgi:hypothetical protein
MKNKKQNFSSLINTTFAKQSKSEKQSNPIKIKQPEEEEEEIIKRENRRGKLTTRNR